MAKHKITLIQPGYSIETVEPDWPSIVTDLLKTRTQRKLAEEIGTSQSQIWRWLNGTTPIKPYQKVLLELWNKE